MDIDRRWMNEMWHRRDSIRRISCHAKRLRTNETRRHAKLLWNENKKKVDVNRLRLDWIWIDFTAKIVVRRFRPRRWPLHWHATWTVSPTDRANATRKRFVFLVRILLSFCMWQDVDLQLVCWPVPMQHFVRFACAAIRWTNGGFVATKHCRRLHSMELRDRLAETSMCWLSVDWVIEVEFVNCWMGSCELPSHRMSPWNRTVFEWYFDILRPHIRCLWCRSTVFPISILSFLQSDEKVQKQTTREWVRGLTFRRLCTSCPRFSRQTTTLRYQFVHNRIIVWNERSIFSTFIFQSDDRTME